MEGSCCLGEFPSRRVKQARERLVVFSILSASSVPCERTRRHWYVLPWLKLSKTAPNLTALS